MYTKVILYFVNLYNSLRIFQNSGEEIKRKEKITIIQFSLFSEFINKSFGNTKIGEFVVYRLAPAPPLILFRIAVPSRSSHVFPSFF